MSSVALPVREPASRALVKTPTSAPSASWVRWRPFCLALAGATIQGSWAFHANLGAGTFAALRASLTQAAISFSFTLFMTLLIERLFRVGRTPERGFWIATLGAGAFAALAMLAVHAAYGKPRILVTIAPSVLIGSTYNALYAWRLLVAARRV